MIIILKDFVILLQRDGVTILIYQISNFPMSNRFNRCLFLASPFLTVRCTCSAVVVKTLIRNNRVAM